MNYAVLLLLGIIAWTAAGVLVLAAYNAAKYANQHRPVKKYHTYRTPRRPR